MRALPADARTLLLVVLAADQLGDTAKVWRAALWGASPEAVELPEVERLVTGTPSPQVPTPVDAVDLSTTERPPWPGGEFTGRWPRSAIRRGTRTGWWAPGPGHVRS